MKKLEEITTLVINVDMVKGFVEKGAMADSYIEHIVPEQIKIMEGMKESIAIIKESHQEGCMEFKRYPVHCVEGTEEAELVDALKKFEQDALVYKKNSTSAMYAPGFIEDIDKMKNLKEVIIIGCCTDICVLNLAIPLKNYFDQQDRDIKITLPKNAVETYDAPYHNREEYNEMAYKLMAQAGINLVETL